MEAALRRRATLIVRESGTPLIGISGHAVGILEKAAQVLVHGEVGPYTVVSYEGRNGYVLSESLADPSSLLDEPSVDSEQPASTADADHRWSRHSVFALLSGTGVTVTLVVGAVLALV